MLLHVAMVGQGRWTAGCRAIFDGAVAGGATSPRLTTNWAGSALSLISRSRISSVTTSWNGSLTSPLPVSKVHVDCGSTTLPNPSLALWDRSTGIWSEVSGPAVVNVRGDTVAAKMPDTTVASAARVRRSWTRWSSVGRSRGEERGHPFERFGGLGFLFLFRQSDEGQL